MSIFLMSMGACTQKTKDAPEKRSTVVQGAHESNMASSLQEHVFVATPEVSVHDGKKPEGSPDPSKMNVIHVRLKKKMPLFTTHLNDLIEAVAWCDVVEETASVQHECVPYQLAKKAWLPSSSSQDASHGLRDVVAQRHLEHERAAVRAIAVLWMSDYMGGTGTTLGTKDERRKKLLSTITRERHPLVLAEYVRVLRGHIKRHPKIEALLMRLSTHPHEHVRRHVLIGLASSQAWGVARMSARAREMMLSDPSLSVRSAGCERLGGLGDDAVALALMEQVMNQKDQDPKLVESCMEGLIATWTGPVVPSHPSKLGYEKTLARMQATPRVSPKLYPWKPLLRLSWAATGTQAEFVDRAVLRSSLAEVIGDGTLSFVARISLLKVWEKLGATLQEARTLRKVRFGTVDLHSRTQDAYVARALDELMDRVRLKFKTSLPLPKIKR